MAITALQQDLLARLKADYNRGFTSAEAAQRRNGDGSGNGGINNVRSPINCPKWVCCLLPCINHVPSMKQFRLVQPDDAEVLRDGNWIRYDHASLVVGDIVRLVEGDVIPADCTVISLGMDHADTTTLGGEKSDAKGGSSSEINGDYLEITVDSRLITGETKPRQIPNQSNGTVNSATLYYGSRVLEGACIAVVTATGNRVVLAKLIKEGRWPPQTDLSEEVEEINRMENEDLESGIALTSMS
mmetsp:Transcript_22660/g.40556  ORF Transcript_22660/g.40556 Transcript_22660/m.40556 type:complete len:243 (-) Transcript_22660:254-982(-)|eukprot:CAMPEP_0201927504 /NCGR_PEP_ID=MMETSP0903-20130614/18867_1 /ASSEMBLY_ACC=CAM_ASM_000552 /TAXON_ID=420261 /ORGANISM="Thalassiosira antarctica, Strain CCMP982" /LENGTH=242 /DNA_ID=CAMNT_0048465717 /DNA_START=12 /DNA_END=740 /DNA_ORIENTATION=+